MQRSLTTPFHHHGWAPRYRYTGGHLFEMVWVKRFGDALAVPRRKPSHTAVTTPLPPIAIIEIGYGHSHRCDLNPIIDLLSQVEQLGFELSAYLTVDISGLIELKELKRLVIEQTSNRYYSRIIGIEEFKQHRVRLMGDCVVERKNSWEPESTPEPYVMAIPTYGQLIRHISHYGAVTAYTIKRKQIRLDVHDDILNLNTDDDRSDDILVFRCGEPLALWYVYAMQENMHELECNDVELTQREFEMVLGCNPPTTLKELKARSEDKVIYPDLQIAEEEMAMLTADISDRKDESDDDKADDLDEKNVLSSSPGLVPPSLMPTPSLMPPPMPIDEAVKIIPFPPVSADGVV